MLIPVILSGGAGSRLWPISREAHPKPFMRLNDDESLLQKTLKRAAGLSGVEKVLTITNREYYFQTRDEYTALELDHPVSFDYVLEPCGRNTAPAIAMAALALEQSCGPEACMLVLAADHIIENQAEFASAVSEAKGLADKGYLVTFGIRPDRAETGYGYIEQGKAVDGSGKVSYLVNAFVEKPDQETAEKYLASGKYLWNSGMFCFQVQTILKALQESAPDVFEAAKTCWEQSKMDLEPPEMNAERFADMPNISIDYAVMEKARSVAVVACEFDWNDVGSWDSVSGLLEADDAGNRAIGEAMLVDSTDCYVHSDHRLVATLGVNNLVIVDTADAVLVADKRCSQDVKKIVEKLKQEGHEAYRFHRTVHRPWGTYTILEESGRFKIKRIEVKEGAELSLQMHHHRSEHWIVVSGTAEVVNGDKTFMVHTDESTYIPAGNKHRLHNPGVVPLVMIEVQTGEYLGEDDIVRFDDRYGRG
ncbi:MAG: mannose-1-phosphate guanylyltransferase/mannose-6-phosphate isomerase [Gammaproteobacteria bacterium]|nr:mannose-1-phosphate guanylyltransferase/mannose-6-phosphate isomerase [Gammaproteobacteria bacterium]